MGELIKNHFIPSELSQVSKCNEMKSQLFTEDETATNQNFKSLESVVIEEDTCKITGDSMFTHTRKNSMFWGK